MSGVLGIVPRMLAVNGGAFVSGAQLFVYNDGTTTKRAIYTTSALSVEHTNPLDADSNGRFPAFYIDPDDGAYKLVLASSSDTDPPASPYWTEDVLPVPGASIIEGNFVGTLTGLNPDPTGTVYYRIIANAAGVGKFCTLYLTAVISGTSDATAMTMTGLPAAVTPAASRLVPCALIDEAADTLGVASIGSDSVITFYQSVDDFGAATNKVALGATGFHNLLTKGLNAGWAVSYPL